MTTKEPVDSQLTASISAAELMSDLAFSPPPKQSDRGIYSDPVIVNEAFSPFRLTPESNSISHHPGISLDDLFSGDSPVNRRQTVDFLGVIQSQPLLKTGHPTQVKMEPSMAYHPPPGNLFAPSLHGSSKLRPPVPNYPLSQISNHPSCMPISNNYVASQSRFDTGPSMSRGIMDELFPQTQIQAPSRLNALPKVCF